MLVVTAEVAHDKLFSLFLMCYLGLNGNEETNIAHKKAIAMNSSAAISIYDE